MITYNSGYPEYNERTRSSWLGAIGISQPQYRVDFETSFVDGQNVSNVARLSPGSLLIRDTSERNQAIVSSGPGTISLSNPVGNFALTWVGNLFEYLEFDFSESPVDYVGWQDIDTTSNNSRISIHFADGTYQNYWPDDTYTTGDSAEFLGFFRGDLPQITKVRLNLSGDLYGVDNIEYGNLPDVDLSGDLNRDGNVDAADYVIWRKADTSATNDSLAIAAANDYETWRSHFGESSNGTPLTDAVYAAAVRAAGVPEPSASMLLVLAGTTIGIVRRMRVR